MEKKAWLIVRLGLLAIAVVFTIFGYVIPQECDVDKVYLWCRLHPITVADIAGTVLFYLSLLILAGFKVFYEKANTTVYGLITVALAALGIILIWNF